MAKVSPIQSNFGSGEFSPLVQGRVDSDRYNSGLAECKNWIPTIQGGVTRRPGTEFVAEAGNATDYAVRLIPFQYSTDASYVLELGDLYVRFFKDRAQILDSALPYELTSPWAKEHLSGLKFAQSADVLYVVHPNYKPRKIIRYADDEWEITELDLSQGPYQTAATVTTGGLYIDTPVGVTSPRKVSVPLGTVTITGAVAGTGGQIAITISAASSWLKTGMFIRVKNVVGTTEANARWEVEKLTPTTYLLIGSTFVHAYVSGGTANHAPWTTADTGLVLRVYDHFGAKWRFGVANGTVTDNGYEMSFDFDSDFTSPSPGVIDYNLFSFGAFGGTEGATPTGYVTGYPSAITFHEDRLFLGGQENYVAGSVTSDYENFTPHDENGDTTAASSLYFNLNSGGIEDVRWMTSDEKGLLVGTTGGEWVIRPSSQGEAMTATNISAKRVTNFGSADVQALQIGKSSIFIQKAGRKVRELTYFYDVDGFLSPDISILAEHITSSGVLYTDFQKEPQSVMWAVLGDGTLVGMTYERSMDGLKVGFHKHTLGGTVDAAGNPAEVESLAVIPTPDADADEVWVSVKRYVDGATVRHIEYLTKLFDSTIDLKDARFLDSSLKYDSPKTVTAITKANPAVVTSTAHGFSNGDKVIFEIEGGMTQLDGNSYTVSSATANTFAIDEDSTSFTTFVASGTNYVRKKVSTLSGLDHLEGQTVSVLADGAIQNDKTVASGAITLDYPAAVVTAGKSYDSDLKLLRLEAGAADGTSIGKIRRIHRLALLLERTLGIKIGKSYALADRYTFRNANDQASASVPLFSGIISSPVDFGYDMENQVHIRCDQPLPATILAIMPQMHTQDRQ